MDESVVIDLAREAIYTVIVAGGPLLLIALTVGLIVSIFQTVTSIQEQTLAFVPKILAVFVGMLLFGPFMGQTIMSFFVNTIQSMNQFIR